MQSNKIKNIEFLRVIGCIAVMIYHLFTNRLNGLFPNIDLYKTFHNYTSNGYYAVALFFVLSGIFFVLTYNPNLSFWEFLKKKIIRLWPVMIFTVFLYYIVTPLLTHQPINIGENVFILIFGLTGTGMTTVYTIGSIVTQFWYVSAMLWTLLFFFYLQKNYVQKNINLTLAILSFAILNFAINYTNGELFIGNCQKATPVSLILYAVACIGIGYFIGMFYKNNKEEIEKTKVSKLNFILITILEALALICIFDSFAYPFYYPNKILYLIAYALAAFLFLIKKGGISILLDRNIFPTLSKYTYSIYITHMLTMVTAFNIINKHYKSFVIEHPVISLSLLILAMILMGVITYHLVEKPVANYFLKRNKKQ